MMVGEKNLQILFGIFAIAMIFAAFTGFEFNSVFAESWAGIDFNGFLQAEDVSAHLTFTFRDGVETHEFSVFKTTADLAENRGTSFQVQGIIDDTPYLHKALDEAFKYRVANKFGNFDYNYKYFDVDVEFARDDGETRKILYYIDCQIADYLVDTLSHSHRGYIERSTGFAIVETIEFDCGGVHSKITSQSELLYRTEQGIVNDLPKLEYTFADDIRTFVTFEFKNGIERMEFPVFSIISGFGKEGNPSFHVEGVTKRYPLLSSAIANARDNQNNPLGSNVDFDAKVEFFQGTPMEGGKLLRGINYEDCRVTGSGFTTYYDHEEPYAKVGGYAMVHTIDFDCIAMSPMNLRYDITKATNESINHNYTMATGLHAITEFRYKDNTIETIDFPKFRQQGILSKPTQTFELVGIVGDYPSLYKQVDDAAKINQISGIDQRYDYFDVDVNLKYDNQTIRGFSYTSCHVSDYEVATQQGNEEGFFFWFALETTFEFECFGYHPKNPVYDEMFEIDKADTTSSHDLKETDSWEDEFKYTKP